MMRTSLMTMAMLASLATGTALAADNTAPSIKDISITDTALRTRYKDAPFAFGTFALTNQGQTDLLLQGISSPGCASVTSNRNSQVAIQSPRETYNIFQRMAVPHEGTLYFPTTGYHLICHGLKVPFKPGNKMDFIFHFQNIGDVTASFTMQPIVEEPHVGP